MTTTDQVEVPDVSVTMVSSNKPKEELGETLGSSSTVDYSSHVSLSSQPQPAWNKGMKILLGCKVSQVHHMLHSMMPSPTANPGAAIQQDNTAENERQTRETSIIC